jgi:spore coat protein U-like protein
MLSYNLYSNSTRSNVWGNTLATSLGTTGTGSVVGLIVYGSVPAAQNKPAGSYSDTVQATINF